MGCCESKNNNIRKPNINIDNSEDKDINNKKQETIIPGNASFIPSEKLKIILNIQKEKSICKIIKNGRPKGTGFLCYITGEYKKRKTLITAYHILGEEDLKIGNEIKLTFSDNINQYKIIKIDGPRRIYANKKEDISIIEILDNDKFDNNNFLEIDENIYNNNIDFYNKYKFKSIYILHYPDGICSCFSNNIIVDIDNDNVIYHFCSTKGGSSGAPILNIDNLKVIGVHQGYGYFDKNIFHDETIQNIHSYINQENEILCNYGRIIKNTLYNFNKENKIFLTLEINKSNIGKKIYFLQNYDDMIKYHEINMKHKININDFTILINDEIYESKIYFKPKKEGKYQIKIFINNVVENCFGLFYYCNKIKTIDLSAFDTKNVTDMSYMFYECNDLTKIDLSSFDTKNVTNIEGMFYGCNKLENIDLSSFNTKNVTDMSGMFCGCNKLENLDLSSFDTRNITTISNAFSSCENLTDINLSSFETKNVTDMSRMFSRCSNLTNLDLTSFDTQNVTNMKGMFYECNKLENIDLSSFNTKNVTNMSEMFYKCNSLTNINLFPFDTKNVTNMNKMFYRCYNLANIDLSSFDTKNVTDMSWMFSGCSNLTNLDLTSFDTKNVTNMRAMFYECSNLTDVNLSSFDVKNTDMSSMFHKCSNLSNVNLPFFDLKNIDDYGMFYGCSKLKNNPYINETNSAFSFLCALEYL